MAVTFQLGEVTVEVILKAVKNVHLSVYPPNGMVRIVAPQHMNLDTIRAYAISKLDWIRKQQKYLLDQPRETIRDYLHQESHYVWGRRCLLKRIESGGSPGIQLRHRQLIMTVSAEADEDQCDRLLTEWYRRQLKTAIPVLLAKWEPMVGVQNKKFFVQRMKTKWGSCNPQNGHIRINLELAKKPRECLEYILVHELIHLIERTHNKTFLSLMNHHLPQWPHIRQRLNRLPLRHEAWKY